MNLDIKDEDIRTIIRRGIETYIASEFSNTSHHKQTDLKKRIDMMMEMGLRDAQPALQQAIKESLIELANSDGFKQKIQQAAIHQLTDKLIGGMNAMMIGLGKKLGQDIEFREEILTEIRRRLGKE